MANQKKASAKTVALGGMLCAVAMVIMCLVGLIPVAAYVCPMLCCILLEVVLCICGKRIAWAWYAAVAILSLLFAPDKEAAVIFTALGYYPIVKPYLDKMHLSWLWKAILFNGSVFLAYFVLISLMGVQDLAMGEAGWVFFAFMVVMGNLTFFLLDRLLILFARKRLRKYL